ncbi:MAG: hypothetical protein WBD31_00330, partial [Rubripirellula sp.]
MTVSNCPRCAEPIRLPVDPEFSGSLIDDAQGECPWCGDSFPMSELVGKLPPMLVVRSADGQPITPAVAAAGTGLSDAGLAGTGLSGAAAGLAGVGAAAGAMGVASSAIGGDLMDDDDLGNLTVGDEAGLNETTSETIVEDDLASSDETVSDLGSEEVASFSLDDDLDDDHGVGADNSDGDNQYDDDVPVVDDQPIEYQLDSIDDHSISADWDADQDSQPMRVSPTRRKKKGAPWKTAVGVIAGGALALPIADGLLTLAGRESILGIWPSKSTSVANNNVRVSPPMDMSDDSNTTGGQTEPAGRALDMPSTEPSSLQDASSAISDLMNEAEAATADAAASLADAVEPAVADYGNVDDLAIPSEDSLAMPAMEMPTVDVPVVSEPVVAEPIAEEPIADAGLAGQPSVDVPEVAAPEAVSPEAAAPDSDAFAMPAADPVPEAFDTPTEFEVPAEPMADSPELVSA